jgi:hypothetical protein
LFHDHLKQVSIGIEIEVNNLLKIDWVLCAKLIQETLNNLGLTSSWHTDQDWAMIDVNELLHQERSRNSINSWNCV